MAWLRERYPERAYRFERLNNLIWEPFPVVIKGALDNEAWTKPSKVSAIHHCKGCSKAIRSTKTWCSFKCQSAYLRSLKQAAE